MFCVSDLKLFEFGSVGKSHNGSYEKFFTSCILFAFPLGYCISKI